MTDLERAREFFSNDVYATERTGIIIEEVKENYAKCSLSLDGKHKNALGHVMGGVFFTLADFTFAVASNFKKETPTVTTVSQISYLRAPEGDKLISESILLKDGRRNCFYEIVIKDNLENMVARVTFNGAHL